MTIRGPHLLGAVLVVIVAVIALRVGCGVPPGVEGWVDDDDRAVNVTKGEEWVATWADSHFCPNGGGQRPSERFRLRVDDQGRGVGTIGICRFGYEDCKNGPVAVRFEARVTDDRIEGAVIDSCHDYRGTEVFTRVR